MATHKHHDHAPCDCEKLKTAEREELREGLKHCNEQREAERQRRLDEAVERAESAETELKTLKKKLIAFQLVTVVASTVLGQEAVDKIMGKVDAAKGLQDKITGKSGNPPASEDKKKPISWFDPKRDPLSNFHRPWDKPVIVQTPHTDGDISGIFSGTKAKPVAEPAEEIAAVTPKSPVTEAIVRTALGEPLPWSIPTASETPADPHALFLTPSAIAFDLYSTGLGLGNNYGFGEYYGADTGSIGPSVPSPSPLAVFAMGGFLNTRKRA
jgi:hypothetical protein